MTSLCKVIDKFVFLCNKENRGENMPLIIDEDTGSVLKQIDGNYIVIKRDDFRKDTLKFQFGHFFKGNNDAMEIAFKKFSTPLFYLLISMVKYNDGYLRYESRRIERKELIKLTGYSERKFDRAMKEIIDEDMIHRKKEHKDIYYVMNPWVIFRGKKIEESLVREFSGTKWMENAKVYMQEKKDGTLHEKTYIGE